MKVIQVGLGPIGIAIAKYLDGQPDLELAGAVDANPAVVAPGSEALFGRPDVELYQSLARGLDRVRPDLVVHATGSSLTHVADQLRLPLQRGIHVVSTCEELSYPFYRHPELSQKLDAEARAAKAVLLGTGVNPGLAMDKLVLTLMAACLDVRAVRVERVLDAGLRREPFQRKVAAGVTLEEFERRREAGTVGHVGLAESAHMLADAIGVPRRRELIEDLKPVTADSRQVTAYLEVEPGQVAGIEQSATIEADGRQPVRMELLMVVGADRPRDAISIDGTPPLEQVVTTGIAGDEGTVAVTVRTARLAPSLRPGLRTMIDVPLR